MLLLSERRRRVRFLHGGERADSPRLGLDARVEQRGVRVELRKKLRLQRVSLLGLHL